MFFLTYEVESCKKSFNTDDLSPNPIESWNNQNGQNILVSKAANQSLFGKQTLKKPAAIINPKESILADTVKP